VAKCVVDHAYFQFRNQCFKQKSGLGMGNPLSPILANIFMSFFEKELQKLSLFPRIWIQYVDDIFVVVKSRFVQRTLNFLIHQHSSIKFTHKMEEDGQLPFLDVLVMRTEDKINFEIYRKPTSTNSFISSESFQHKNLLSIQWHID
jgi:retron-type reverse transcriptase